MLMLILTTEELTSSTMPNFKEKHTDGTAAVLEVKT